jgi:hypothetical protein
MLKAKVEANRRPKYIKGLGKYARLFARSREQIPLECVTAAVIEEWFGGRGEAPVSRRSNLGRLSAIFSFAVRRGYLTKNPCKDVEKVTVDEKTIGFLTVRQSARCILWTRRECPRFLAWVALTLFGGLRPEAEADLLPWSAIDLKNKRIMVEISKVRGYRPRIMDLNLCPPAVEWLRVAKEIGAPMQIRYKTRRFYLVKLRKYLGFKSWPQDILRHTAASNLLAFHQDAAKVSRYLGNSAGTLLKDYAALIYKEDAEKFMRLLPKARHSIRLLGGYKGRISVNPKLTRYSLALSPVPIFAP